MTDQNIVSQDVNLKRLFQDFYRVPSYQREYVWGEQDGRGEGGEQVDEYLADIFNEYQNATSDAAPEYFIGTIVVCREKDEVFDLIDGQQRTTTSYLTICALRDALTELGESPPEEMNSQIASTSVDWQGEITARYRLDLQYEDAAGVLSLYADGEAKNASRHGTRSIRNIGNAYDTIREFLATTFKNDPKEIRRFYGYLTNKVKVIRIETPTVTKALKIFETINDRGVGLDSMDLLKNLLFIHAKSTDFDKLKNTWKSVSDAIYRSGDKPLRFLRYYLLAMFDADTTLREDLIYDWLQRRSTETKHATDPLGFAQKLLGAAEAYEKFSQGKSSSGDPEAGIENTRALGGKSIKQHFIILLAGRHLSKSNFSRLATEVEKTLFVWLIVGIAGKEYERLIVDAAHQVREVGDENFDDFLETTFIRYRTELNARFRDTLQNLRAYHLRQFRLRYLLAKVTQHFDLMAYGPSSARSTLSDYTSGGNDIEHILPYGADAAIVEDFGEGAQDISVTQRIGNLLLLEKAINRSIGNKQYAAKLLTYQQSKFLLTRCQASGEAQKIGVADKITKAVNKIASYASWNKESVEARSLFLANVGTLVWDTVPSTSDK
ncbi:DUF262 domain-containing protein [Rhizobium ruizarguesonis]|uniref:DUF262 domain-containing protein n=1 Tax=Rhizobium ruizarguesonis TaxID=2081791 RepID=UPI0010322DDA|nr:DUF262 domain-containing protein [Rhizobium ruizarguesonis]TBA03097.1 DUF262 domain-containing protein [Rhizobium ruizarguesonis]